MAKKSINLLPPSEQKLNRLYFINYQLQRFGIWLIFSLIVFVAILLVGMIVYQGQRDEARALIDGKKFELSKLEESFLASQKDIGKLNKIISNFQVLKQVDEDWSLVLIEFARLLPDNMVLNTLRIDRESKVVEVSGSAGTRNSILLLRRNILASEYFRNINFPLANLEKAEDADWSYRFYVNPMKLKK